MNLLEEILRDGFEVRERKIKNDMINTFGVNIRSILENTNDVEIIKTKILDLFKELELQTYGRYY